VSAARNVPRPGFKESLQTDKPRHTHVIPHGWTSDGTGRSSGSRINAAAHVFPGFPSDFVWDHSPFTAAGTAGDFHPTSLSRPCGHLYDAV